jgi:transcriptional regulator
MYVPAHFREDDLPTLHALMCANSFATLVTQQQGIPLASHLPFTLASERGRYGTLACHMARANAQWRSFSQTPEVLVIFQGPHAYITPSWYEVHPSVPTWNYAVVHAYGTPRIIEDEVAVYELLRRLVQTNEAGFAQPWQVQPREGYIQHMMRGIVAFEIEITRLEGKYKLSQNRSAVDQQHVIDALSAAGGELEQRVAALMQQRKREK